MPTTPRLAPWDHVEELSNKLERLIAVLEAWFPTAPPITPPPEWPGWEPVLLKLDEIKNLLQEKAIADNWVAKSPEEILRQAIRTVGSFTSEMVNWTKGKRLVLVIRNTLDQALLVQPIGNIREAPESAINIGLPMVCAAFNGRISIGFAWDDWQPFIGCIITTVIAPTAGEAWVEAVLQE